MTKVAFVFPGQGSQYIGMLNNLYKYFPMIKESFDYVSQYIHYNIWDIIQNGPISKINKTINAQIIMLTTNVTLYNLLQSLNMVYPYIMAGHSIGEYSALVCSNSITFNDAIKLVMYRGKLMQENELNQNGTMAAIIGLNKEKVEFICRQVKNSISEVYVSNYNSIQQIVVSGKKEGVQEVINLSMIHGAKIAKYIPIQIACHCPMLKNTAEKFYKYLQNIQFNVPEIDTISNVDLSIYNSTNQIRYLLKEHIYRPVRWVEIIQLIKKKNIHHIVECGPGRVLSGLIKRIDKNLITWNINDIISIKNMITFFKKNYKYNEYRK